MADTLKRKWTSSDLSLDDAPAVRVMSYNILDDSFICQNKYRYCPKDKLFMQGRHSRIVAEILEISADVICLQEVAKSHFDKNLLPDLKQHGYCGIHMNFKNTKDGLAMFFKKKTIQMVAKKSCPTQNSVQKYVQSLDSEDQKNIMNLAHRSQGCLLAKCLHVPSGKLLTVGNIHISWTRFHHPGLSCLEAASAVHHLRRFAAGTPFLLTGDFNSTPDFAPYNLMRTGKFDHTIDHWNVKPAFNLYPWNDGDHINMTDFVASQPLLRSDNHPRFTSMTVETDRKLTTLLADVLNTNTPLRSAYAEVTGSEPITNIEADDWKGYVHELCLDFMWFSDRRLLPHRVLDVPCREILRKYHALPSQLLPSDHIAIATEFYLN